MLSSRGQRSLSLACFGLPCDFVTLRSMARKDVLLLGRCQVPEPTSCLWQSMRRRDEPRATGAFRMCWPFPCRLLFSSEATLLSKREEGCHRLDSRIAGCRSPLVLHRGCCSIVSSLENEGKIHCLLPSILQPDPPNLPHDWDLCETPGNIPPPSDSTVC